MAAASHTAPLGRPATTAGLPAAARMPAIPSQQLLHGQSVVYIEHNGITYRLQATRQGKLILTK